MKLRPIHALPLLLAALAFSGCGGGDDDNGGGGGGGATSPPASTQSSTASGQEQADGAEVFASHCSSCHTLAAAGAKGVSGPNLDDLQPDFETVHAQVENGGGGMPAFGDELSPEEIDAVSRYVASEAGG